MSFKEIYEQENYENTLSYIVEEIEERYDTYLSEDEIQLVYETLMAIEEAKIVNFIKNIPGSLANKLDNIASNLADAKGLREIAKLENEGVKALKKYGMDQAEATSLWQKFKLWWNKPKSGKALEKEITKKAASVRSAARDKYQGGWRTGAKVGAGLTGAGAIGAGAVAADRYYQDQKSLTDKIADAID